MSKMDFKNLITFSVSNCLTLDQIGVSNMAVTSQFLRPLDPSVQGVGKINGQMHEGRQSHLICQ